jgi:hypothetical protein
MGSINNVQKRRVTSSLSFCFSLIGGREMSERIKTERAYLLKAIEFLKRNNIEDPDGHLARKCARECIEFIQGRRKS